METSQIVIETTQQTTPAVDAVNALSCFNCALNLTGYRYILRDDKPFCIKCYEQLFANRCEECKEVIGTDFKDLSYKDKHWHEKCFNCADCRISLVDKPFASKNEKTYCPDCHDKNFAQRCDACGNIFRAGMKKYEFKGKSFHEECFCCKVCRQPIGVKTFIPRDQEAVCVACYEEQYAQRCVKCNGVINKGGITYKSAPYHRECFTCTGCNKMLVGEKFTSKDDKPYCAECFAQNFAKKCVRCFQPITGLGTTKFISFDDRHWHNDCFQCYKCQTSLVGRGFVVSGDDVLCPDCGRA
jgi:LIM domain-containing protein 2